MLWKALYWRQRRRYEKAYRQIGTLIAILPCVTLNWYEQFMLIINQPNEETDRVVHYTGDRQYQNGNVKG